MPITKEKKSVEKVRDEDNQEHNEDFVTRGKIDVSNT